MKGDFFAFLHTEVLIGSRGEGPIEYVSAVDFEIDASQDAVYLFDIFREKIKVYHMSDGNKVAKDVGFDMGKYLLPMEVSMNNELYNKNLKSSYIFELNANRVSDFIYMNFCLDSKIEVLYDNFRKYDNPVL